MTAHIDEGALQSSLQWLREAPFDADVAGVMKRTVDAVHGVFGYGGAGVMFITESGYLSYVAASDEAGRQLEEAQASAGQGPCYDSYVYAREVVSSDVHADSRWPELRTRLSAQVRAVGYLMGTHHLDAVTAFDVLRRRARDSRRLVADVATEILGGSTGPASDDRVGDLPPPA